MFTLFTLKNHEVFSNHNCLLWRHLEIIRVFLSTASYSACTNKSCYVLESLRGIHRLYNLNYLDTELPFVFYWPWLINAYSNFLRNFCEITHAKIKESIVKGRHLRCKGHNNNPKITFSTTVDFRPLNWSELLSVIE